MINFEANIVCHKELKMTENLIGQLRMVPDIYIRVWDNSPKPLEIAGADEVRHNRFNPSLSRSWNWAIAQSESEWVLVANEDINLQHGWFLKLIEDMSCFPSALWHGPSRFFFFNRKLLDLVGWFDENLIGNTFEDLDYVRRMNHAGVPTRYGRSSSLWETAVDLKPSIVRNLNPLGNIAYMAKKYVDMDTENFFVPPLFPTPNFYPRIPK